ncbi:MAG: hypothetical protein AABX55_02920 [Nanoarchaeota archaeon]
MNKLTKWFGIGALSLASIIYGCSKGNQYRFHENGKLSNGELYGKLGALTYLLDNEGKPISKGFHTINPKNKGYSASLGACDFELNEKGAVIQFNRIECLEDLIDYDQLQELIGEVKKD